MWRNFLPIVGLAIGLAEPLKANESTETRGDVPQWVADEFDKMMRTCLPSTDKIRFKKKPKEVSFLPQSVVQDLGLDTFITYRKRLLLINFS